MHPSFVIVGVLGLIALAISGCAEPPDAADPARMDAAVADATARPVGSACRTDADCDGICLLDPRLGGRRCVAACAPACPAGTRCQLVDGVMGCLPGAEQAPVGAPCGIDAPCVDGAACVADVDPRQTVCALTCADDAGCPAGEACSPAGVCAPAEAPVFRCPFVDCARDDLLCVDGACVATCADVDTRCVDGGRCTRRESDGALLCLPTPDGGLGERCVSGGAESCTAGLTCLERAPGDPAAVCSRACADGCPDGFACRRPEGFAEAACLSTPFGVGAEIADRFESCAAHGATDCLPALDCVTGPAGAPVCAAPCAAGCADDAVCDDAGLTPHCRRRTRARIGLACAGDGDCPEGRCVPADVPYCTAGCDPNCPPGFYCAGDECLVGEAGALPLGAPCGADGAAACESGLCAADPRGGEARCTRLCPEDDCPDGFACETLDANRLCFPTR